MKKVLSFVLAAFMVFGLCACKSTQPDVSETPYEKKDVNIYVLTGPTGIGSVNLWEKSEKGEGLENYHFTAASAPDEAVTKISKGEADIAAVATNLASKLYTKTEGKIKVLAVNTSGVLYGLSYKGKEVSSVTDLKGRKIYTTGQGANPEYILNFILEKNGIDPKKDVTIEFKSDASELAAVWATDSEAIIVAPQPAATTVLTKYEGSKSVINMTEEWDKVASDSALMMGCVIVRTEFLEQNPTAVENFLKDYADSIAAATADVDKTAQLCENYGIIPKAAVAKKAIPQSGLCFVTGEEMKTKLSGYLKVLFDADPTSVGKLPDDNFWYEK